MYFTEIRSQIMRCRPCRIKAQRQLIRFGDSQTGGRAHQSVGASDVFQPNHERVSSRKPSLLPIASIRSLRKDRIEVSVNVSAQRDMGPRRSSLGG